MQDFLQANLPTNSTEAVKHEVLRLRYISEWLEYTALSPSITGTVSQQSSRNWFVLHWKAAQTSSSVFMFFSSSSSWQILCWATRSEWLSVSSCSSRSRTTRCRLSQSSAATDVACTLSVSLWFSSWASASSASRASSLYMTNMPVNDDKTTKHQPQIILEVYGQGHSPWEHACQIWRS